VRRRVLAASSVSNAFRQPCLNLRPLSHGHGSLRPASDMNLRGALSVFRVGLRKLVNALVRQSKQSGRITGAHLQASSAQDTHGSSSRLGGAIVSAISLKGRGQVSPIRAHSDWLHGAVPKTVPARSSETGRFPKHFAGGGFLKTIARATIESRSRKCHLLVYLPSAVRWPRG
jgi:hypothetical protein